MTIGMSVRTVDVLCSCMQIIINNFIEMQESRVSRSLSSPNKQPAFQELAAEKQSIVTHLMYVFVHYSAKASKYSYKEINEKCFMELMEHVYQAKGSQLPRNSLAWKTIASLFHAQGRKHGISFNEFLALLSEVAVVFTEQKSIEDSLKTLVDSILRVYSERVASQIEKRVVEYSDPITEDTHAFIMKLLPNFSTVYKLYFPNEQFNRFDTKSQPEMQSFENLLTLMKEFEVYPKLISASNIYFIYNETMLAQSNSLLASSIPVKEQGKVFTLPKFVELLIAVSRVALPKLRQVDDPEEWQVKQKEMLKIFLEYLETVRCKDQKKSQFNLSRFSFIVYQEYPEIMLRASKGEESLNKSKARNFFEMLQRVQL